MNAELKAWKELEGFDLSPDWQNLPAFLREVQRIQDKVSVSAWFVVHRNGRVITAGTKPVMVCSQVLFERDVDGFCKHYLLSVHDPVLRHISPVEARLLRIYQLDAVVHINLRQTKTVPCLVATLRVEDRQILTEVEQRGLLQSEWQEELKAGYFLQRELSVDFKKRDHFTTARPKKCLLLHTTFKKRSTLFSSPMQELEALSQTLGFEVLARVVTKADTPVAGTFLSKGKYEEVVDLLQSDEFTHVLLSCDPMAYFMRNLEEATLVEVWSRTDLILQIFAQHARTEKSRLQVELAQLMVHGEEQIRRALSRYRLNRGYDIYEDNYRQSLADRKKDLKLSIEKIQKQEDTKVLHRSTQSGLSLAVIGYTNAGKSTLFNSLLEKQVVETENVLFKTLDTTTRILQLGTKSQMLISDTVGFIQNMPPVILQAFYTTLAECRICSHLLLLLDPVGLELSLQLETIKDSLQKVERIDQENWILVVNKSDLLSAEQKEAIKESLPVEYFLSAQDAEDVENFREFLLQRMGQQMVEVTINLGHHEHSLLYQIRESFVLTAEPVYTEEGVSLTLRYKPDQLHQLEKILGRSLN